MTQAALAARAGTTQSAIARLESGRTSPALEDVIRLLRLTGFDLRVELVPDDDSDRVQAADLASTDVNDRLRLNGAGVRRSDEMRAAFVAATGG